MNALSSVLVAILGATVGCAQHQEPSPRAAETAATDEVSFTIYPGVYPLGEQGSATLPSHVRVVALPRVNELGACGHSHVDNRITIVVEDDRIQLWSFMAKLDKYSALKLLGDLDAVLFARGMRETKGDPSMRVVYGTQAYTPGMFGSFVLPEGVELRVLPELRGFDEKGMPYVDDRLTLVVEDDANNSWPVIASFDDRLARIFRISLARAIAEHEARG